MFIWTNPWTLCYWFSIYYSEWIAPWGAPACSCDTKRLLTLMLTYQREVLLSSWQTLSMINALQHMWFNVKVFLLQRESGEGFSDQMGRLIHALRNQTSTWKRVNCALNMTHSSRWWNIWDPPRKEFLHTNRKMFYCFSF